MYFGHINESPDPSRCYPAAIAEVIEHLRVTDFASKDVGSYPLRGKDIYVQVIDTATRSLNETKPEFHHKYLDVHFLVRGVERIGFACDTKDHTVVESHPERDLYFYDSAGNAENFVNMAPGCFAVFYPWDIHRPAVALDEPMSIRKVVVKVALHLITGTGA